MLKVSFGSLKKSADYNFRLEFYLHQASSNRSVIIVLLGERSEPHTGLFIEILHDIYMSVCRFVYKKYVCQNAWAELHGPNTSMLKSVLGG